MEQKGGVRMIEKELLPCPFCGGKARVQNSRFSRSEEGHALCEVVCMQCGVFVLGEAFNFYAVKYNKEEPQDKMSAIKNWNRRAAKE